jgi:hypothetical protein
MRVRGRVLYLEVLTKIFLAAAARYWGWVGGVLEKRGVEDGLLRLGRGHCT